MCLPTATGERPGVFPRGLVVVYPPPASTANVERRALLQVRRGRGLAAMPVALGPGDGSAFVPRLRGPTPGEVGRRFPHPRPRRRAR